MSAEERGQNAWYYRTDTNIIYIDKEEDKAYLVSSFYNDFTGRHEHPGILRFQPDGTVFMPIDATTLLQDIKKVKSDPEIKIKNREDFLKLAEGMTENDNPVLIIGKVNPDPLKNIRQ